MPLPCSPTAVCRGGKGPSLATLAEWSKVRRKGRQTHFQASCLLYPELRLRWLRKQGRWRQGAPRQAGCWMHLKDETLLLWVIRGQEEKPHGEDLHPGSHTESLRGRLAWEPPWAPSSHLNRGLHPGTLLHPSTPPRPAQQTNMALVKTNQSVGSKEVKRGRQGNQGETLLAAQPGSGLKDFAAASPNISFHGNPGEKRGAFILKHLSSHSPREEAASAICLGQRTRGVYEELGRPERDGQGLSASGATTRLIFLGFLRLLLTPRDLLPALTPGVLSPQAGRGPALTLSAALGPLLTCVHKLGGEFAEDAPEAPLCLGPGCCQRERLG